MSGKLFGRNKGSALVQVIIVLVVFSILSAALLILSNTGYWQTRSLEQKTQSYYYSKAGVEMARNIFDSNFSSTYSMVPFYYYGSIKGPLTRVSGLYTGGNTIVDNSEVFFQVTKTTSGAVSTVRVESIGNVAAYGNLPASRDIQTYVFDYTEPQEASSEEAESAGPEGFGWYHNSGHLMPGDWSSLTPVKFDKPGGIKKFDDEDISLTAPAMYFVNTPHSVSIKNKLQLTLSADFIKFDGGISGGTSSATSLFLFTNKSTIDGSSINGVKGTKYGAIYIGKSIDNVVLKKGTGYYYFPNNIGLFNQSDIDKLIKIDKVESVNSELLGTSIISAGGVQSGKYK